MIEEKSKLHNGRLNEHAKMLCTLNLYVQGGVRVYNRRRLVHCTLVLYCTECISTSTVSLYTRQEGYVQDAPSWSYVQYCTGGPFHPNIHMYTTDPENPKSFAGEV